eukprot:350821-Chlamydomonas_euryale.AAC.4
MGHGARMRLMRAIRGGRNCLGACTPRCGGWRAQRASHRRAAVLGTCHAKHSHYRTQLQRCVPACVIPVDGVLDEDPVSPLPPGCPGGGEDKLGRLLAETPLRRLHAEERCARQLSLAAAQQACGGNTDAAWALVRCRQRMLALAKLYSPGVGPYAADDAQVPPMLLADSHFKLAQVSFLRDWAGRCDVKV